MGMDTELKSQNACLSLLADFLKYAIDETNRISGDDYGCAGVTMVGDTYEKIAEDYISKCSELCDNQKA